MHTVRSLGAATLLVDFPVCRPHAKVDETTVVASTFDVAVEVGAKAHVASVSSNFAALEAVSVRGVAVCALAEGDTTFVGRSFAPGHGVYEGAVTGSMIRALTPVALKDSRSAMD